MQDYTLELGDCQLDQHITMRILEHCMGPYFRYCCEKITEEIDSEMRRSKAI